MSYFDMPPPSQLSWRWNFGRFFLIFSLEAFSVGLWILIDPEEICAELGFLFLTIGFTIPCEGDEKNG